MYVVKRDGRKEQIMFDKITARVRKLCYGLNELVDPLKVAMRVIDGLYDGVTTSELDNLAAEIAATMTTAHPDYARLAARISVSNLHKSTKKTFSEVMYTICTPMSIHALVKTHHYFRMKCTTSSRKTRKIRFNNHIQQRFWV